MGRRVNSVAFQGSGGGTVDGFFDKIVKYIPSDVMAAWTAAIGIIMTPSSSPTSSDNTVLWIAFAFGTIFTAVWTWFQTKAPDQPPAIRQIIACTISFVVWAFALPTGPSSVLGLQSKWGSLLLIGWTLVLGLLKPDPTNPPGNNPGP